MTITATLLLLIQVSAPGPENWSYVTCMMSSASAFLSTKPTEEEYRRHIGTACKDEYARQRRVIIAQQISKGRSRGQAEADADEFFDVIQMQMLDLQPVRAR